MPALPPSKPPSTAWIADPLRDFVCFRLIDLAAAALDATFTIDAAEAAYRRWLTSAKRKPSGRRGGAKRGAGAEADKVAMFELNAWRRDGDHAVLVLAQPNHGEFMVVITEEQFKAEVLAIYDPDSGTLIGAGIESFEGDREQAILVAQSFVDMLDDTLVDDLDGAFETDSLDGDAADHKERVAAIVERLILAPPGRIGDLSPAEEQFLAASPEALWAIRDGFVAQAKGSRQGRDGTVLAWQTLLERQLEEIRFKAERKHAWAEAMIDHYQADLLTMAQRPGVDINTWQALVIALDRAKIPIKPEVRAASIELTSGQATGLPGAADIMRSMEEIVETGGGDPFRIAGHLFDAMTMMPSDFANAAVAMISNAPLPALRDVVPLVLLSPEAPCRQAAAAALERMAAEKRLTPAGLRRLITLRAWLPEAERPTVDQAVRRARLAGIDCAPWPAGQVRSHVATVIDGSGCQSLVAVAKDGTRHLFAGILVKQGFGVRDVMAERNLPKREADAMLSGVSERVKTRPVSRTYRDRMIQHALATGCDDGRVPPLALLEIAEVLGAAEWRAQRLDAETELAHLLTTLPPDQATPEAAAQALRRSGTWTGQADLAGSWFEDDETARDICARHRRSAKKAASAILETVLEARRGIWAERLFWMALWAEGGSGEPYWYEYALVAKALYDGRPLSDVPLMAEIARLTVACVG